MKKEILRDVNVVCMQLQTAMLSVSLTTMTNTSNVVAVTTVVFIVKLVK